MPSAATPIGTGSESLRRQGRIGLALAAAIIAAFLALHAYAMLLHPFSGWGLLSTPLLVAVLTWLYVGLFIIAHDCMHGSLAPGSAWLNRRIGQLCLLLYAGFSFDRILPKHHLHHTRAGTDGDPDFDGRPPHGFWRWYLKFFGEYFSGRELAIIAALTAVYHLLLGVALINIWVLWALPALLSSVQLFAFGTWLPHRPAAAPFTDRHNARSNDYPVWLSLLTCFHFGYHHEHHVKPGVPWWRLPAEHARRH